MNTPFFKIQGTGNDFVAFDFRATGFPVDKLKSLAQSICDRRFGIGADGILALFPPELPNTQYTMVYLNADGSDAGMCGNGGRCIARLAHTLGIPTDHSFSVHLKPYSVNVNDESVALKFPAEPEIATFLDDIYGKIEVLNTGTEHICIKVSSQSELLNLDHLKSEGRRLRYDDRFAPKGTNVNFYFPTADDSINLITYERGVEDLTLSCGTGSLAAAICHGSITRKSSIQVNNRGGTVHCGFKSSNQSNCFKELTLKGPAEIVFQGSINLE
jgi:diaminopimelate epimerase